MNILRHILLGIGLVALPLASVAQNGNNSSYSRFGLGTMADQSQTFNRGMGGVALGLRSGDRVNILNPASYSAIDSLTFLFDVGMSAQFGTQSMGGKSASVRNASLTNVNAGFRVAKGVGVSFGFVPYTSIGYSFESEGYVGDTYTGTKPITSKSYYTGNGGLHQLYIGAGWNPFANLSIGANISYVWGDYQHYITQSFYEGSTITNDYSNQNILYSADLSSYKLDLGLQYPIRISKDDQLTLGLTYSLGHTMNGDASQLRYTSTGDSTEIIAPKAFDMPHTFGAGLAWNHKGKLKIAADANIEKWADCKAPIAGKSNDSYTSATGNYLDRTRIAVGAEFLPRGNQKASKYWETVYYRVGLNYSTPYLKVNGQDGPNEIGASIGAGIPLSSKRMSGRSFINVSAEWKHRRPSASNMIKENYFMINLGVTFNEDWFSQWKIN